MRNRLVKYTISLALLVGVLDFLANEYYFYWTVSWYDMMMHFLAGVLVAFAIALFWHYLFKGEYNKKSIFTALAMSLFVGLVWEWYELYFELTSAQDGWLYYRDTISDLFLDLFGTVCGLVYIDKYLRK